MLVCRWHFKDFYHAFMMILCLCAGGISRISTTPLWWYCACVQVAIQDAFQGFLPRLHDAIVLVCRWYFKMHFKDFYHAFIMILCLCAGGNYRISTTPSWWYCACVQVALQGLLPRLHDDIPRAVRRVDRAFVAMHASLQRAVHGRLPARAHHRKFHRKNNQHWWSPNADEGIIDVVGMSD